MSGPQTEAELLGLDSSPLQAAAPGQADNVDDIEDIEAEILLMSSSSVKPSTESSEAGTVDSTTSGNDAKLAASQDKKDVLDEDDLLLEEETPSSQVKRLDEKKLNSTVEVGSSDTKNDSDKVEYETSDLETSSVLADDDSETDSKPKNNQSKDRSVVDSKLSSGVSNVKNPGPDSAMEVIDDDEDEAPKTSLKRKLSDGDNSENVVEIIDDDDYDDDELEIIDGSESEAHSDSYSESEEESNSFCEGKICIYWSNGSLFVWNAEDAQMIREECRILGKLTGCLPRAPRQNNHLGLPLQLMPEEAQLLVDIDAAVVVQEEMISEKTWQARQRGFTSVREDNVRLQVEMYKESRKEEVKQKMPDIIAGKKAKRQKLQKKSNEKCETAGKEDVEETGADSSSDRVVAEEELEEQPEEKLTVEDVIKDDPDTHPKHTLVQIFTENPWKRNLRPALSFHFPVDERDRLRYAVFKDLWKQGYFLSSGAKFGGDFLVYPGDPSRFHSHFIAVCLGQQREVPALDVVSMGRLASNVRKTTVLCSLSRKKKVIYTSLQWTGMS